MLLALDIGNTNITAGVFDGESIVNSWRISTGISRTEDEFGIILKNLITDSNIKITDVVISSVVVELTQKTVNAVKKYFNITPLVLTSDLKLPITIKTDTPSEAGADRIANAAAAAFFYKLPVIVVDLGTATSFDIINDKKEFIGGIISAGMRLQAEALGTGTSKLPKSDIELSPCLIGKNTKDAMLSGIVRGHAAMIEGLLNDCKKELGENVSIIFTGGYSSFVIPYMSIKPTDINPDLTLAGMKKIYDLNKTGN